MIKLLKKFSKDRMLAEVDGKIYRFTPCRPATCECGLCGNKWRPRKGVALGVWMAVPERTP